MTNEPEEILGVRALRQWDARSAVRVITQDGNAIVLERAGATLRSVHTDDDAATLALCQVAARVHANAAHDLDRFPALADWFRALLAGSDSRFNSARDLARDLLRRSGPLVLLHGDLHSENVLDSPRGWLAIDPKGIAGPREFDYGNIFTNWTLAEAVARFDARLAIVSTAAHIEPQTLLQWVAAWSALSATWHMEDADEDSAALPLAVMDLALDRLTERSPQ